MAASENVPHVQAKFLTRQDQYAIPDTPYSVPVTVGVAELNTLVNSILQSSGHGKKQEFDFLINEEFLRLPLQEHVAQKNISTETVIEIEYVERQAAPEPEDSLLHDDWVSCVQASGDFILSGSYDNTVRVWNSEGDLLTTIPGHLSSVKCCSWIKREDEDPVHCFVTGSHDNTLLMWEWNQQRNAVNCVHTCRGHAASVDCVAVDSSTTRFCSGSWDKMLKVWSAVPSQEDSEDIGEKPTKRKKTDELKVPTRVPLVTLSGHNEGVSSVVWLSDKEVATSSWDHSIRIWDIEQAQSTHTINGSKVFFDISYSPLNNTIIAASADRHLRLYDPRSTEGAVVKNTYTSHMAWVSAVAWSPINPHQFISGGYDNLLKLWDTRSPKAPLYDMTGHEDKILAVDWTMPQRILTGAADNHLKIFTCHEGKLYKNI